MRLVAQTLLTDYIAEKRVTGSLLTRLEKLSDSASAECLAEIVRVVRPSANSLREVISLIDEISFRDELSFSEVVNLPEVQVALGAESINGKDRLRALRTALERYRFPTKARLLDELESCRKSIREEFGVYVTIPEEMEGLKLKLEVYTSAPDDFKKLSESFDKLAQHPAVGRIYSLLRGES